MSEQANVPCTHCSNTHPVTRSALPDGSPIYVQPHEGLKLGWHGFTSAAAETAFKEASRG